jgi:hypothetical protein
MSFFDLFPDAVNTILLSEWCAPNETAKFDTACTNHSLRYRVLDLFVQSCFVLPNVQLTQQNVINGLHWVTIRQVKMLKLDLDLHDHKEPLSELSFHREKITHLKLSNISEIVLPEFDLAALFNSCPSLISVILWSVESFNDIVFRLVRKQVWNKLSEFEFLYYVGDGGLRLTDESVSKMSDYFSDLMVFGLVFNEHISEKKRHNSKEFQHIDRNNFA